MLRLLAAAAPARLSDDLYRYVWEGRVQLAGVNPYLVAPGDPVIAAPGDPIWEGVNHKAIPAAYPPATQLFGRALAAAGAGVGGFRLGFACCDLLLLFLLAAWLARAGADPSLAVVHALCPLVLVELGCEGHNDALALLLCVAALAVFEPPREGARGPWRASAAGALLGLAIAAKLLPLVLVPFVARKDRRVLPACAIAVAACYAFYWPGAARAGELFAGLGEYGARWRHNDSLFWFVHSAVEPWRGALEAHGLEVQRVAKIPVALALLVLAFLVFRRRPEPATAMLALLAGLFALAPALHPWYVVWALPFCARRPSPALLALAATVSLSYEAGTVVKLAEFLPFYALLARELWRARAARAAPGATGV